MTKDEKREYMRNWRLRNKDKISAYNKRYRTENRTAVLHKKAQYRADNRERLNAKQKEYAAKHKEHKARYDTKYRATNKQDKVDRDRAYHISNIAKKAVNRARYRAKQRGLEFDITEEDFIVPEYCPILGLRLEVGLGKLQDNSPTLDRIDNSKGYVKGNVHIISWRANNLKADATPDELRAIADYVDRHWGKKNGIV